MDAVLDYNDLKHKHLRLVVRNSLIEVYSVKIRDGHEDEEWIGNLQCQDVNCIARAIRVIEMTISRAPISFVSLTWLRALEFSGLLNTWQSREVTNG